MFLQCGKKIRLVLTFVDDRQKSFLAFQKKTRIFGYFFSGVAIIQSPIFIRDPSGEGALACLAMAENSYQRTERDQLIQQIMDLPITNMSHDVIMAVTDKFASYI
jgi:hypothetical protein